MATVGVKGLDLEIHINSRSSLDLLYTTVNNSLDTHVLSNKMTAYKTKKLCKDDRAMRAI